MWNFEIFWDAVLGEGGEGKVVLGRAVHNGQLYAIKVSTSYWYWEARSCLMREFERHSRAYGDGIVSLVAWDFDGEIPFLAYELADQGTLADEMAKIRRQGKVYHPTYALDRIRDLLVGLRTAHEQGILHRDVKPSNALVVDDQVKLADFGIGRTLARPRHLQTRAFVGTEAYAAPEQRAGRTTDHRADLYAVGVILYEMLMGVRPSFDHPLRRPSRRWKNVTKKLDLLVGCLLEADPRQRPRDANEAIQFVDLVQSEYDKLRRLFRLNGLSSPY